MGTLHGWGQSQRTREGKNGIIAPLLFKRQSVVKATTDLSLSATLPRQTAPGWAIVAELQEHRLIGMLNQEKRAFPPFTEGQELKKHSPRSGWKDFLKRGSNESQESLQKIPGCLKLSWDVHMASLDCSSIPCSSWTNPEFSPWSAPKYFCIYLRPCSTPHLSLHIPSAPAAKGTSPSLPAASQCPAVISQECLTTPGMFNHPWSLLLQILMAPSRSPK